MHPNPTEKQVLGALKEEERAEGRGARTGSTGVGPTRQPHGPRWTGCTRLTPVGAVGPTRQPHPRARAADGRAPHGSRGARPKAATPAQPTGDGAPAPRWSPPVTTGAAERRPREGREGGSETAVHGSPRVDGGDGNGDRSGGRRRRGSGRRGRRRSGGRQPKRRGGRDRRGRGGAEGGDAEAGEGPRRRRRRTGARR
uniref:Splicing coactivator subunit-like n=1 Tax=Oryza sativa subsp. japonica TaxID=39947 RepID=Q6ESG5_ORYSJ|nr:splicing coactivator subunit-like [Oryza sativa Japonica Group]